MSLYRNFFNVGAMTLLSRVLGFGRDMLMANVLGTGLAADAFFAAFRFPNLFRRLFAEGAFNAAFIPLFSGALEREGEERARELATRIISWLIGFLLVVTIAAEIFMPYVLRPFVPGFLADPEKYELTVFLTRICFPYLAFMSLMAAYGGILNGLGKFLAAAFAPVLLNVVLVTLLAFLVLFTAHEPKTAAMWVAIGTIIGGIAQLGLVIWAVRRTGFLPKWRWPHFDSEVRRFWVLALPAILSGGITQINIFIGTIIASGAAGAISYLYYADRLYQLPLGIIGIAIGVVLLPELSRHLKGGRADAARDAQDRSLQIAMLLGVPAAAGLAALSSPIIGLLFERGAFGAADTLATATALNAFAVGLPAFVLIKVFQPGFFAREDTLTPTIFAAISVATNIAISLALFPHLAQLGIAIGTSVSAWLNALMLATTLLLRGQFVLNGRALRNHALIIVTAIAMGLSLWFLAEFAAPLLAKPSATWVRAFALTGLIATGMAGYFGVLHVLRVQRLSAVIATLRRSR